MKELPQDRVDVAHDRSGDGRIVSRRHAKHPHLRPVADPLPSRRGTRPAEIGTPAANGFGGDGPNGGHTVARARHEQRAPSVTEPDGASHSRRGILDRSKRPTIPTVSVVIPTLNEARNLPYAMWRLPECVTEVIVVDGRSTDDTVAAAESMHHNVRVVLETTRGKGAAMRRGCDEATGDIIVLLDADGSADGAEISRFVDVLVAGADFAKGSRFLPGGGSGDLTRIRSLGNRTLTGVVNLLCQTRFTDLCYGYNAFWSDCLEFFDIDVAGFEVETRVMMMVAASGLTMVEVPSWEFDRVHGTSNLHAVGDGLRVLRTILSSTRDVHHGLRTVRVQSCSGELEAHR